MSQKVCLYCLPSKRTTHLFTYISGSFDGLIALLPTLPNNNVINKCFWRLSRWWLKIFLLTSRKLGLAQFDKNPPSTKLKNRGYIFFEEAKKKNLQIEAIKFLGIYIEHYRVRIFDNFYYYREIPTLILGSNNVYFDTKDYAKEFLKANNIPTPEGKLFLSMHKAIEYSKRIGFPLVVKPNNGSLSQHVICNIRSNEELLSAINISKIFSPFFLLEKHITGHLFRITIIGKKYVYAAMKEVANVTGDGKSTLAELINDKNKKKYSNLGVSTNTTSGHIEYDEETKKVLLEQNISRRTVVPKNKKIYLKYKNILRQGCDITSQTSKVAKVNIELFLSIAKKLDTNLIGIDCLAEDLSLPYSEQAFSVLEFNSFPYVDLHQSLSFGTSDKLAEQTWDFVINEIKNTPS